MWGKGPTTSAVAQPTGKRYTSNPAMREHPAETETLPLDTMARLSGFGRSAFVDVYRNFPESADDVLAAFEQAKQSGVRVVLRGSGRSYGDAAIGAECLALDFGKFNRIFSWDSEIGVLEAEPGVTIGDVWRHCLADGWWPPVVSGTMFPTLAGALAMNIHGKNAFREGTLGEHVVEIEVAFPNGACQVLTPADELFYAVISSAGLIGAIVRVKLRLKRITAGVLDVYAESCSGWDAQFSAFDGHREKADYMVSWVDGFGAGRGLFHSARYVDKAVEGSLRPKSQDLPSRMMGVVPKSQAWRILRLFNHRFGMRSLNLAKHLGGRMVGNRKTHRQSLGAFSFLLDYVPEWERSYLPGGFIQYQSFVPEANAKAVFAEQARMQRAEGLENFLGVLKRHRRDRFLFSHGVDGYSMAMDFKVGGPLTDRVRRLCHSMNDLVLDAGGRFYFAKDSTLRREDVLHYLGEETLKKFQTIRAEVDPNGLLTSELGRRLGLSE